MADTSQRTVWYAYMSLVSLTGSGCTLQRGNDQTDLCETTQCNSPLPFFVVNICLGPFTVSTHFFLNVSTKLVVRLQHPPTHAQDRVLGISFAIKMTH